MNNRARAVSPTLPAAFALGALYLRGLAPTVHVHDAGELTAAAWTLGLGHPPGAPLYMLLSKAFMTMVPYGHVAWRANLLSAIFAVALVLLLASWAERRGSGATEAIVIGAVAALAPVLWSQALMAEVYTLQALLLAAALVSLDLKMPPEVTALLWGLLLTCHVGLAPLTPIVLLVLVIPQQGWRDRLSCLIRVGAAAALPLLLYLYVPLRAMADPAVEWSSPDTLEKLWWYLSNQNVRARSLSLPLAAYLARTVEYGGILVRNLHVALAVALIALVPSRGRRTAFLALLVVLFDGAFVVLLDTAPLQSEAYGIPAMVAVAVLVGLGLEQMAQWRRAREAAVVFLATAVIVSSCVAWPRLDLSDSFVIRDTAEAVLSQVPPGAVLFTQEDNTTFPLAYLMLVEGARPDVRVFDRAGNLFESPYDRALHRVQEPLASFRQRQEEPLVAALLEDGQKVFYTTPFLEFAPRSWTLRPSGTIARAERKNDPVSDWGLTPPPPRQSDDPDWMSRQVLAMDHVRRAAADLAEGRSDAAKPHLIAASELAGIAEIHLRIAQLAVDAGDLQIAEASAAAAIKKQPILGPAWSLSAQIALLENRLENAEELAEKALTYDAELAQAWFTLGLVAIRKNDWDLAETRLTQAIELGIGGSETWINRALVRERSGDLAGALSDLAEATARDPSGNGGVARITLLVRSNASREDVAVALCAMADGRSADTLDMKQLTEMLLVSARAGAPTCVEDWLQPLRGEGGEAAEIVNAYLGVVHDGSQR